MGGDLADLGVGDGAGPSAGGSPGTSRAEVAPEHGLEPRATTTQAGAIAECLVAAAIMESSGGILSPFRPMADDDGIDLLLYNKRTHRASPLQIKGRRSYDNEKAKTVQFDVRKKMCRPDRGGDCLFVKLDGLAIEIAWLIPMSELPLVAYPKDKDYVSVVSAKPDAEGRFRPYRKASMAEVVAEILARNTP